MPSEFWADTLKRLKNDGRTDEVLELCRHNLKYPAGTREMAIALRKKIRECGGTSNPEIYLKQLYEIAAYDQFLRDSTTITVPSSEPAPIILPSFNVAEIADADNVRRELPFPYQQFGYKFLGLLNKTDMNKIVETWGEPTGHKNPRQVYQAVWNRYAAKFQEEYQRPEDEMFSNLRPTPKPPQKKWWWPF